MRGACLKGMRSRSDTSRPHRVGDCTGAAAVLATGDRRLGVARRLGLAYPGFRGTVGEPIGGPLGVNFSLVSADPIASVCT